MTLSLMWYTAQKILHRNAWVFISHRAVTKSRLKPLTFKHDIDLKQEKTGHGFFTLYK